MNAAEFNLHYNKLLVRPLVPAGFMQQGAGLFFSAFSFPNG